MKYLTYLFIIFGVVFILSGCGQESIEDNSTASETSKNLESVAFKIDGFT